MTRLVFFTIEQVFVQLASSVGVYAGADNARG
nr:TPA_asm: M71 uORF 1 [Murid betaherpesvirus 1]DBA07818.1 TPA_asm: M71 uORF 1 [Murid betaherpesvirus 1]